jgi:hypothetical protein
VRSSQTVTRAEEIDRKTGRFWAALEVAMLPVEKAPYHEPVDLKHDESLSRLLIALSLSAVFIAVFLVRCYLGADLTSLAVEMVAMLVMFCTTYALFLAWSFGETMAYQFLTCVALEWLFCSDNTLNMFGWYVTSDVQLGKILQMIGFGVVVQAVPRLVGLPVLAHYFAQSPEARHVTSSLLFITACRNMYVAWTMKYEDRSSMNEQRWAVGLPMLLRFTFAEFADLIGNTDGFFAKILVTRDAQLISISGAFSLLLPRAFALLLLDQKQFLESRQHAAVRVMLFVSGVMLLTFVAHVNDPKIPDIPLFLKLIIVVTLYGFLFFIGYRHTRERATPRESIAKFLTYSQERGVPART